jgi:hypothetical protein
MPTNVNGNSITDKCYSYSSIAVTAILSSVCFYNSSSRLLWSYSENSFKFMFSEKHVSFRSLTTNNMSHIRSQFLAMRSTAQNLSMLSKHDSLLTSLTMKKDKVCIPETLVKFYHFRWHNTPGNGILHV